MLYTHEHRVELSYSPGRNYENAEVDRRYFRVKIRVVQGRKDRWPGPDSGAKGALELRRIAAIEHVTDVEFNRSFGVFEISRQEM